MSQNKPENNSYAPARQYQQGTKSKTMAPDNTRSLSQIDVTKPLTREEQLFLSQKKQNDGNPTASPDQSKTIPELSGGDKENGPLDDRKLAFKLYKSSKSIEELAVKLKVFVKTRPNVVIEALAMVKIFKPDDYDDLGVEIVKQFEYHELKTVNKKLLEKLYDSIDDNYTTIWEQYELLRLWFAKKRSEKPKAKALAKKKNTSYEIGNAERDKEKIKDYIKYGAAINDSVGANQTNAPEDVKLVALKLKELGIDDFPDICLNGKWDKKLGNCIKTFQSRPYAGYYERLNYKGAAKGTIGVIKPDDPTFKALFKNTGLSPVYSGRQAVNNKIKGESLKNVKYNKDTYKEILTENREDYKRKLDKIPENIGDKRGRYKKLIQMAEKAATDQEYFYAITNDVKEKLALGSGVEAKGDITLNPLLIFRMKRFHKFLVLAGLYDGNMNVKGDGGVRTGVVAHRWSTQSTIDRNIHSETVKKNLIEMYKDTTCHKDGKIIDKDGNPWAKKVHFYEYTGSDPGYTTIKQYNKKEAMKKKGGTKTGIYWDDVRTYVATFRGKAGYRSNSTTGADEGYDKHKLRRPNYNRPISHHCNGTAMDVRSNGFVLKTESLIDLIGLRFGVIRCGGANESWHFELTGVVKSEAENEALQENGN